MNNIDKMVKLNLFVFLILFLGNIENSNAQGNIVDDYKLHQDSIVYQIRTGINIGGFTPLPFPAEIREIKGFNPRLNFSVEGSATYWIGGEQRLWGIKAGIKLENKGMKTDSKVKNYSMEILGDNGERVAGNWTGGVSTQVVNSYITIPISVTYAMNKNWEISLGTFCSLILEKDFSGYVYDGYLREGGPTGNKVEFRDDNIATYDFSSNLRQFTYGIEIGGYWNASRHLNVFSNLSIGLNDIFKSDFKTITFEMKPIYLNVGFGYVF